MITTYYRNPQGNIQNFISSNREEAEKSIRYLKGTGYSISDVEYTKTKCRVCGCDDEHACKGGCYWYQPDLCSQCYEKSQQFDVMLRQVHFKGEELIDIGYEAQTLAEGLPTNEFAEGFVYGYVEGKGLEDLQDTAFDDEKTIIAIGISIWQNNEPITEFFFSMSEVHS
jgi:hypothetical protein